MRIDISFDDCNVSDLRASKMLAEHGFKGTFYMPSCQVKGTVLLTLKEVKEGIIDLGHELGGHTVNHPSDLKTVTDDKQLKFEIENNKALCELLMKKPVTKFCYPRGRHDERVRKAVKDAGFLEARTTNVLNTDLPVDPFQTHTTVHMFQREEYEGVDWFYVAKQQFEFARAKGDRGMFNIWGHSKELDLQGDWGKFKEMLKLLKSYPHNAFAPVAPNII